ncbi:MAG: hypothetical protein ABW001_11955 [Mycobacterium sp.]
MTHHVGSEPTPAVKPLADDLTRPSSSRPQRATMVGVAIALVAIALASWSLLRPMDTIRAATPAATTQETDDAKEQACTAATTVGTAVSLQTHADPGGDPAATQAFAANARLAMVTGSAYLLARLDPATPPPLSAQIRTFADELQTVVIHTMAGVNNDDPAQAARLRDVQTVSGKINELCTS